MAFFLSLAVWAATRFFSFLRSAFSSGLKCVSLCLFRTGGPAADELESESEEAAAWLGSTKEIGRLKEEELLCLPGMRRTLWEPPVPAAAVTTTMALLCDGSEASFLFIISW